MEDGTIKKDNNKMLTKKERGEVFISEALALENVLL